VGRFGEKGGRCGADGWGYCIEVARLIAGFGERGVGLELRGRSAGLRCHSLVHETNLPAPTRGMLGVLIMLIGLAYAKH